MIAGWIFVAIVAESLSGMNKAIIVIQRRISLGKNKDQCLVNKS